MHDCFGCKTGLSSPRRGTNRDFMLLVLVHTCPLGSMGSIDFLSTDNWPEPRQGSSGIMEITLEVMVRGRGRATDSGHAIPEAYMLFEY